MVVICVEREHVPKNLYRDRHHIASFRNQLGQTEYCWVPGRTTWTPAPFCRALIVLPGACVWNLDTYFNLSPIYQLYTCFICRNFKPGKILSSISYPAILFILAMGFLNRGGFIIHTLLQETSKSWTLSLFLPGTCIQPFTLFCRAHNDIRMHISHGQVCLTYLLVGRTWAGWGSTCGSHGHSHRRTAADPAWEKQMQIFS